MQTIEDKLLSISIAAYNMEKLLAHGLDSLVASKHLDQLDILVINDGSKDGTQAIAERYQKRYPGSVRAVDKENGNYGSTINASLRLARGKYFRLMDADDWYDTQALDAFLDFLAQQDADMVVTPYHEVNLRDNRTITHGLPACARKGTVPFDECRFDTATYPPMHMLTFRTSLLADHGISITEGCPYTDFEFIVKPVPFVETVSFCDTAVYQYRFGVEDQSVSVASWQRNIEKGIGISLGMADYYNDLDTSALSKQKDALICDEVASSLAEKFTYLLSFDPNDETRDRMASLDSTIRAKSARLHARSIELSNPPTKLYRQHPSLYTLASWMVRTYYHRRGML